MSILDLDYGNLIDERNQNLYNRITVQNDIYIEVKRNTNGFSFWTMNYEKELKTAEIFAGEDTDDINAFTHELLHIIQEESQPESYKTLTVYIGFLSSPSKYYFMDGIVPYINNVISHARMLPDYLEMRFPLDKFVFDYYTETGKDFFDSNDIELVVGQKIKEEALKSFLKLFFYYRFHPNEELKNHYYELLLDKYSSKNLDLINGLKNLCKEWEEKRITFNKDFFNSLLKELDSWKKTNNYR